MHRFILSFFLALTTFLGYAQTEYTRCGHRIPTKAEIQAARAARSAPAGGDFSAKFASVDEAANYIRRIVRLVPDWTQNFQVAEEYGTNNAAASIRNGQRYITYDNDFVEVLDYITGTKWASISVLAHEVGHHYFDHLLDGRGSTPYKEVEADYFSGYILSKMGASLADAKAAMSEVADPRGSYSHPPRAKRLAAIEEGWYDAKPRKREEDPSYEATFYSQQPDVAYIELKQERPGEVNANWFFDNGTNSAITLTYTRKEGRAQVFSSEYTNGKRRVELYFFEDGRVRERDIDLRERTFVWYNFSKH